MATKTNKSYTKRIKITKHGKLLARKAGQNHFNAKASRRSQLDKKKRQNIAHMLNRKAQVDFLPHLRKRITRSVIEETKSETSKK